MDSLASGRALWLWHALAASADRCPELESRPYTLMAVPGTGVKGQAGRAVQLAFRCVSQAELQDDALDRSRRMGMQGIGSHACTGPCRTAWRPSAVTGIHGSEREAVGIRMAQCPAQDGWQHYVAKAKPEAQC